MNINTRLYVLTVLNILVCLTVGTVGYVGIERLHPHYNNTGGYPVIIEALDALESAQNDLRAEVLTVMSTEPPNANGSQASDSTRARIERFSREVESRHVQLSSLPLPVEVTWNVADSRRHVERLIRAATSASNDARKSVDVRASNAAEFSSAFEALRNGVSETKDMVYALWEKERAQSIGFAQSLQNNVVTSLLLGVACIIVLVLITLRSIIRPIGEAITALGISASEVNTSAQKMSVYAEDLAQSATQQAAAVQESVASMTQMSSMIAQTSDSSNESLANARRMADRTQDGNRIMERLTVSTEAINQANSQLREMVDIIAEISGKTSVINDIVFKTQLLSFNASIEAARAGQHGRGFAVVAEEFGSLAEISGKAAKEIQSLLETSKKHVTELVEMTHQRVSDGLAVSKEALAIFNEISRDTNQITKQIQRISEATREQTIGVQQTSTAMNQMDQAAQRNSLLAGDTLRSASGLSEQSQKLASIMRGLLTLTSGGETTSNRLSTSRAEPLAKKTHVFEVDEENTSLDLGFLQDAAERLGKRSKATRGKDSPLDEDDFQPYDHTTPR
jgi:nucleoside-triphosphatase THEP1